MREQAGRVLSALIALPLLFAAVRYLPPFLFAGLIVVVVGCAQYEFYRMALGPGSSGTGSAHRLLLPGLGLLFGAGVVLAFAARAGSAVPLIVTALVVTVGAAALWRANDLSVAAYQVMAAAFGVWYIAWLFGHFVLLRGLPGGEWLVLAVLWVTWIGDSAAYYAGRAVGRTPLAPRISPKKTVAGGVAGVVGSAVAAVIAAAWFVAGFAWWEALVLGAGAGLLGMTGDLVESMFKRSAGVKDSGGVIPAHGGILDKIDGLLFTAPMFYYYLVIVKGSGAPGMAALRPG